MGGGGGAVEGLSQSGALIFEQNGAFSKERGEGEGGTVGGWWHFDLPFPKGIDC